MNAFGDLTRSFAGWNAIIAGKSTAREQFRTDARGFFIAAVTLGLAILLSLAAQSAGAGMPTLFQLLFAIVAQALTMTLLAVGVVRLLRFLKQPIAPNILLVPILYVLAYAFIVGIPLTLLGPMALLVPLALIGLIWRAGMVLGAMNAMTALAVALLCVIVLVVVPNALYMLLLLVPSA
ncbi:MAG TPA: hypothetical protein VFE64_05290 [Devosia sp.]|nr:hypothetical protein [Devosia sp.]